MLFNEAKKFKLSMKYQFLWTRQGQIMIRKTERSKIWKIFSLRDLANIQKFAGGKQVLCNSFSHLNLKITFWYTFVTLISA